MKEYAEIYAVYILQQAWGCGYGYALFEKARHELLKAGFEKAYLWVLATNQCALQAYTRWGGKTTALVKQDRIGTQPVAEVAVVFSLIPS